MAGGLRVGLGCVKLGSASGPSGRAGVRLVHAAIDAGVTLFDTADAYVSGESERILGRAIAGRRRDAVEIATKGGYRFEERSQLEALARRAVGPALRRVSRVRRVGVNVPSGSGRYQAQDFSPRHLTAAIEASLRRLGTDHVDTYQLHGPDRAHPELMPFLLGLVERGLVRRIGIGAESIGAASDWLDASAADDRGVDMIQIPFGPLDGGAAETLLPTAADVGVDLWARGVFGGGVLAAADAGIEPVSAIDLARATALRSIAAERGLDVYELAVAFIRSHPQISTMVLGMSSVTHLQRNVDLVRSVDRLPDEVLQRIRRLADADEPERRAT